MGKLTVGPFSMTASFEPQMGFFCNYLGAFCEYIWRKLWFRSIPFVIFNYKEQFLFFLKLFLNFVAKLMYT